MNHDEFHKLFVKTTNRNSWIRLDPNSENWIPCKRNFKDITGMTIEEFYESKVPRTTCSVCGQPNYFARLDRGWSKFCSKSCATKFRSDTMWLNDNGTLREKVSKSGKLFGYKNIHITKKEHGFLYLCEYEPSNIVKIGASTYSNRYLLFGKLISIVEFDDVFKIEYQVHSKLDQYRIDPKIVNYHEGYTEMYNYKIINLDWIKELFKI